ncbi:MAG TPA: O-antigen ligase family protein, partial [Pyrinomonadaceae bacterium]
MSNMGWLAYVGTLVAIFIFSIPGDAVQPWHKGVFVAVISMFGVLRILDGSLNSGPRVADRLFVLPLVGVIALAVLQIVPFGSQQPLSLNPYGTLTFILQFAALIVAGELLLTYTRGNGHLRHFVALVLLITTASALFGLSIDLLRGEVDPRTSAQIQDSYAQFTNRNHFALLIEMGLGLLAGILLKGQFSATTKSAGWLVAGILVYSMIAAGSRGGLVSMTGMGVFAVFVHVMTRSKSIKRSERFKTAHRRTAFDLLPKFAYAAGLGLMVIALVLVLVAFIGDDRLIRRMERIDNEVGQIDGSRENRAAIWASTTGMIRERPLLGSGFG